MTLKIPSDMVKWIPEVNMNTQSCEIHPRLFGICKVKGNQCVYCLL